MNKIVKNKKGITLVEILVALTIFTVTILSATQIFNLVIQGQRNSLTAQNVQESMRYAFEAMGKEIRMAQKSDNGCLVSGIYKVYNTASGNTELYFKNKDGLCVKYYLLNNRLAVSKDTYPAGTYITSNEIKVNSVKFIAVDDLIGAFHQRQPRVTMVMDVEAVGKVMHKQNMKIQITISSRYYE